MEIVNSILITVMVVLLLVTIVQVAMDTAKLKENAGQLVGLVIWLLVVIAIGFQELPWLKGLLEKKA
jgi:uncharacterized membrane protein